MMNIQWYPGHMTKTKRQIEEEIKFVDIIAEIIDARIPVSSRNPDLNAIIGNKPHMIILNRADQADPVQTKAWKSWFLSNGSAVLETDSKTGKGVGQFSSVVKKAMKEKIEQWNRKGQTGRTIRIMVVGIPNVGKSTFINRVAKKSSAKAEDRPGITRGKQWIHVDSGLDLLDTPGLLWPKFEDKISGMYLAFTGAIKGEIVDSEELAVALIDLLRAKYPGCLEHRYHVDERQNTSGDDYLELCAKKRGMLISGGEADTERMAKVLLDEFQGQKLGRFTLETPDDLSASRSSFGRTPGKQAETLPSV